MNFTRPETRREKRHQEFDTIVADTESLLASMANATGDKAHALRVEVERGLASARERLADLRRSSMEQVSHAACATDGYVHANPWRTVGIVAAVSTLAGIVIGLGVGRRRPVNGAAERSGRSSVR